MFGVTTDKRIFVLNHFTDMAPFYEELCTELKWQLDKDLLAKMKEANEKKLKEFDEALKDAEENLGETEIRDVHYSRAEYLCKIGDKVSCGIFYCK